MSEIAERKTAREEREFVGRVIVTGEFTARNGKKFKVAHVLGDPIAVPEGKLQDRLQGASLIPFRPAKGVEVEEEFRIRASRDRDKGVFWFAHEIEPANPEPKIKYCPACGGEISLRMDAAWCGRCGRTLDDIFADLGLFVGVRRE
ncbi:MAG: hypothetical protein ACE5PT_12305 [Gemmatimonadales bacterium]